MNTYQLSLWRNGGDMWGWRILSARGEVWEGGSFETEALATSAGVARLAELRGQCAACGTPLRRQVLDDSGRRVWQVVKRKEAEVWQACSWEGPACRPAVMLTEEFGAVELSCAWRGWVDGWCDGYREQARALRAQAEWEAMHYLGGPRACDYAKEGES